MALKLFAHAVSQPSRAVIWALKLHGTPFEFEEVNIIGGGTRTPEFLAINPAGTVPTIVEGDFKLFESNAILTYLADKYQWEAYYPKDLQVRAKINEYLHWHHQNTRLCTLKLFRPILLQTFMGIQAEEGAAEAGAKIVTKVLGLIEKFLGEHTFLVTDQPTIADIACYCEIDQLEAMNLYQFDAFPNVQRWITQMKALPLHDEVHEGLNGFVAVVKRKAASM
eukprot:TRINITY_DN1088_c0_g1_i1.p2 TRINITY_DN1088_c0_g1~~TRINITY_DN1088_c0_g1_i1.p2  ORF type:complete len:246 (+),score=117.96 TRINITY_DN1088_c0_g1_i1:70-738(+)